MFYINFRYNFIVITHIILVFFSGNIILFNIPVKLKQRIIYKSDLFDHIFLSYLFYGFQLMINEILVIAGLSLIVILTRLLFQLINERKIMNLVYV